MADPKPQDDPAQSKRFMDLARELGASDDTGAFDGLLDRVVKSPVTPKASRPAQTPE